MSRKSAILLREAACHLAERGVKSLPATVKVQHLQRLHHTPCIYSRIEEVYMLWIEADPVGFGWREAGTVFHACMVQEGSGSNVSGYDCVTVAVHCVRPVSQKPVEAGEDEVFRLICMRWICPVEVDSGTDRTFQSQRSLCRWQDRRREGMCKYPWK